MNNERRTRIAGVLSDLGELRSKLETLLEEEQEAFDAMPESFQDGERGEKAQTAIDALQDAVQAFEEIEGWLEDAKA